MVLLLGFAALPAGNGGYRSPFAVGFAARQLGMGGTGVADLHNAGAIYWNPAGLANIERSDVQLFHMTLFMETRYDFFSASYPTMSLGAFGLGIGDLSSGSFDRIDDFVSDGTFSSRQDLLIIGYGFPLFQSLQAGFAVKGAYYDLADYKDTGFGFDFGLIYSLGFINGMSVGLKATDISGPRIRLNTIEQRFPFALRGGLAYSGKVGEKNVLNINADLENTEKLGTDIYVGGEFGFNDILFARAGYMGNKPTFGVGIRYSSLEFDYAFASMPDLDSSHRLSLIFTFGPSVKEKREARDQAIAETRVNEYKSEEQQRRQARVQDELDNARKLEGEGKTYEAIEAYYKVLGIDVQNEEALGKVTTLLDQIKSNLAAEASKGYNTQLIKSQLEVGDNYYDKKQYDKAQQQYNLALVLDPTNEHAKERLADIQTRQTAEIDRLRTQAQTQLDNGQYEQALESLNKVLAVKPDDKQALNMQDSIVKQIKASQYLSRALRYFDQAEYQKSQAYADSTLALNPNSDGARSLKRQLNRYTASVTTIEDIKKNDQHWQVYLQGMEKYQAGEYKEAIKLWQSLLEYYPNNPNLKRNIEQATERSSQQ